MTAASREPKTGPKRIPSLDGLRAVSILLVLVSHASRSMPSSLVSHSWIWPFLANSQLGVRTFFVISGYLITGLLVAEHGKTGTISLTEFYKRRTLRIFPAFYAHMIVLGVLISLGVIASPSKSDLALAATYTWNYGHLWLPQSYAGRYLISHIGTLSIEEQFYLLWPATLAFASLARGRVVASGIVVVMPFVRVASYFLWPGCREHIGEMLHTTADSLMFGATVALFAKDERFLALRARLVRTPWPALAAAVFVLLVSPFLKVHFGGAYELPFGYSLECACIVVVLLHATTRPGSLAGRVLNSPPMVAIGVLSYSLYLWSMLFFTGINQTWTGRFPMNILVCFTVATLSYNLIEKPCLRLRDLGKRRPAPTETGRPTATDPSTATP